MHMRASCKALDSYLHALLQYGLIHISVGDLLRDEVKNGSKAGKEAKSFMDAGKQDVTADHRGCCHARSDRFALFFM